MTDKAKVTGDALLRAFAMFAFTPDQVIKIGSFAHLVEMFGANKNDVVDGVRYLLENGLLIQRGEFDFYLTETGCQTLEKIRAEERS